MLILEIPEQIYQAGKTYGPYVSTAVSAALTRYRIELELPPEWPYDLVDGEGKPLDMLTVAVDMSYDDGSTWSDHFSATFAANQPRFDRFTGQPLRSVYVERNMGVAHPSDPSLRRVLTTKHTDLFRVSVVGHVDCVLTIRLTGDE